MTAVARSYDVYPATYREKEMRLLADWIQAGESGAVVGLVGCGRSNLLGFLCHRPEVLKEQKYLPDGAPGAALIPVDLNDLPAHNLSTLYRIILRAFNRVSDHLEPTFQRTVSQLYQEHLRERDPLVAQSALQDLLLLFQAQQIRVALVLNRFDHFCHRATPQMINTLRALRDDFKDTLCYIVGMRQEVAYLENPEALGDMYDLLDTQVCWVGTMSDEDARYVINQATQAATPPPSDTEIETILKLTGNFPALTRTVSQWWLTRPADFPQEEWKDLLLDQPNIRYRLDRMWEGLTEEEKYVLTKIQELQPTHAKEHRYGLHRLEEKGLCKPVNGAWQVYGDLLTDYTKSPEGRARGRIWMDEKGQIFQGTSPVLDLPNLEYKVLKFFIENPRSRQSYSDIFYACWPYDKSLDKENFGDINAPIQVVIYQLRRKIEPSASKVAYIINYRGTPEGGYIFYPEGRPK